MSVSLPKTQNANTPLSLDSAGQPQAELLVPMWRKYTVTYADLATAATTNNITVATLPAGGVVEAVKIKHSAAFTGGAISAYTVSVGITGTLNKYAAAYDVFQAPSATAMQLSTTQGTESHTATTALKIAATSTGANLSAATAGSVDVWIKMSAPV
jgi:hypothetical protein